MTYCNVTIQLRIIFLNLLLPPDSTPDLQPNPQPRQNIDQLPDPLIPASVTPDQNPEDISATGYRTRFGRLSKPPPRS